MLFQKVFIPLQSEYKMRQIIAVCFRFGAIKKIKYGQQDISFRIISAFCCQRESSNSDAYRFAHNGEYDAQPSRSNVDDAGCDEFLLETLIYIFIGTRV